MNISYFLPQIKIIMTFALFIPEVVLLVCTHLTKRDVIRLSQTNTRLRSITLSQIYKTITWRWNTEKVRYPHVLSTPPIHLLLRSLMAEPSLREYVESIDFEGAKLDQLHGIPARIWRAAETPGLTTDEIEHAVECAKPLQHASPDIIREGLTGGDIDIYACLVISLLPNLRSLALGSHFISPTNRFQGPLFHQAVAISRKDSQDDCSMSALPSYMSLQRVKLGRIRPGATRASKLSRFEHIISFLYLPSLEAAAIELPRAGEFIWPDLSQRSPITNLVSLELPFCKANESALKQLLASKPPLKKLVYNYLCDEAVSLDRGYYFSLPTLSLALSYVQPTIESLTVCVEHLTPDVDTYICYERGYLDGSLAPFLHFPRLKYLEVPMIVLTGWEVVPRTIRPLAEMLPKSIQHLCLTDWLSDWHSCDWEVHHWLERLSDYLAVRKESRSQIAPDLHTVEVQMEHEEDFEWDDNGKEEFKKLGEYYAVKTVFSCPPEW